MMVIAFFSGSMLGGAIAGLPFDMEGFNARNLILCLLSKVLLMSVFTALFLMWSAIARQKLWMSLVGSMCTGMFFFMMIPMLTPLDAGIVHVLGCGLGGALFSVGLGWISVRVLNKTSLV